MVAATTQLLSLYSRWSKTATNSHLFPTNRPSLLCSYDIMVRQVCSDGHNSDKVEFLAAISSPALGRQSTHATFFTAQGKTPKNSPQLGHDKNEQCFAVPCWHFFLFSGYTSVLVASQQHGGVSAELWAVAGFRQYSLVVRLQNSRVDTFTADEKVSKEIQRQGGGTLELPSMRHSSRVPSGTLLHSSIPFAFMKKFPPIFFIPYITHLQISELPFFPFGCSMTMNFSPSYLLPSYLE